MGPLKEVSQDSRAIGVSEVFEQAIITRFLLRVPRSWQSISTHLQPRQNKGSFFCGLLRKFQHITFGVKGKGNCMSALQKYVS